MQRSIQPSSYPVPLVEKRKSKVHFFENSLRNTQHLHRIHLIHSSPPNCSGTGAEITIGTEMIGQSIQCQANNGLHDESNMPLSQAVQIDPYCKKMRRKTRFSSFYCFQRRRNFWRITSNNCNHRHHSLPTTALRWTSKWTWDVKSREIHDQLSTGEWENQMGTWLMRRVHKGWKDSTRRCPQKEGDLPLTSSGSLLFAPSESQTTRIPDSTGVQPVRKSAKENQNAHRVSRLQGPPVSTFKLSEPRATLMLHRASSNAEMMLLFLCTIVRNQCRVRQERSSSVWTKMTFRWHIHN